MRHTQKVKRKSSWNRRGPATATLLVITVLFLAMAWLADATAAILRDRGVAAQATVVTHRGGSRSWTEVTFSVPDGRSIKAVLDHSLETYTVGETMPVRYDPARPELVGDERSLEDRTTLVVTAALAALSGLGALLTWLRVVNWEKIARRWG